MPDHTYLVLSRPPDGVSDDEFNAWYEGHIREILEVPGFVSAQRSSLKLRGSRGEAFEYTYLAHYGIDGDLDASLAALREAVQSGRMYFPDWFKDIRTAGFQADPIADAVLASG